MASPHATARARLLASLGRPAALRRRTAVTPPAYTTVTVQAAYGAAQPAPSGDGLRQAVRTVEIAATEIAAANWPAPPRPDDTLVWAEGVDAVTAAVPLYDGDTLLGYRLWVRGA